ncbi:MAG TPA: phosphate ABC transporter permease PstA [Acidimicrobiales bacterium]|nr:phosphate ABC transporter permease PstA [Acidimicrobiales bacterium]
MSRRRLTDLTFWVVCALAFVFIAAPSVSILASVIHQAVPSLGWSLFSQRTNANGIENAILGTLVLLVGVLVVAGTIGVAAGIYLAEFATGRSERLLRFFSDVLSGMPSIVVGYVGYVTFVVAFHWGFSLLAGVIALTILVLPYVVKTTEVAFRQVPTTIREAAAGLGIERSSTVLRILMPPAAPGVLSGLIVALAISTGELAPLLFTAGFTDQNPSLAPLHRQVPYLTNVTFTDLSLPGARAHATAAAAAAVSLVIVVLLITAGRALSRRSRRMTQGMML